MPLTEDVRYSLRAIRRQPGFAATVIAALAIGIGANASVFTVVKSVLLAPLPMRAPEQLVAIWQERPESSRYPINIPNFLDYRARNQTFQDLAAYGGFSANLAGEANPERVQGARVTANYFQMLGVDAAIGRALEPDDETSGRPKVVVLTAPIWRRRFGADPAILGRTITLNGDPHIVAGVLPPTFAFHNPAIEFAVPLYAETDPFRNNRKSVAFLRAFGRLKPNVTLQQARQDLNAITKQLVAEYPVQNAGFLGARVTPLQEELTNTSRQTLLVLLAAVGCVLLIACANIASLLVAKAAARQKELAVRAALGATGLRLAWQMLTESLVLAIAGGALGTALAYWGVQLLLAISPAELPRAREVHMDITVLLVSLATSVLCGLLFGLLPALQASGVNLNDVIRTGSRGSTSARMTVRRALVIVEVSLALVLLTGAGLLLKSFHQLTTTATGFDATNVETLRLALPATRYKDAAAVTRFHDTLRSRLADIPGVESVGATSILPLSGPIASISFTIAGRPAPTAAEKPSTEYRMIDSSYFRSMRIPILRGRDFADADTATTSLVTIVSAALAQKYWPDQNPVGQHVGLEDASGTSREAEVIGVAGSVHELELDQPPTVCLYVKLDQIPPNVIRFITNNFYFAVRARTNTNVASAIARAVQQVDGSVAANTATMESYLVKATAARRYSLRLLLFFAFAALVLAASGLYGLVSFSTAQRTREIGVRIVMGATRGSVAGLVLRESALLAACGIVIGTAASWALSGLISSMLYHVDPHDPWTAASVSLMLLAVVAIASFVPTRRATNVDPQSALRDE